MLQSCQLQQKIVKMTSAKCTLLKFLFISFTSTALSAVSLNPCTGGYFEVAEGVTSNIITCGDLTNQNNVTWRAGTNNELVGTCPVPSGGQSSDTCTNKSPPPLVFNPARTSVSESTLTINTNLWTDPESYIRGAVTCQYTTPSGLQSQQCNLDYIFRAAVVQCQVTWQRWSVSGSCDVTKMYSANSRYSCQWTVSRDSSPGSPTTGIMTTANISGGKYKTGRCTLPPQGFPTVDGTYSYTVLIYPGTVTSPVTVTGFPSSVVARPTKPSVTCSPNGFVPENTDITCTCTTTNIGTPTGRLVFRTGTTNINADINSGSYGVTTLQMTPQRLVQADHNVKKFRCDLEWAEVVMSDVINANVGYPLTQATLTLNNNQQDTEVNEGQSVTLTCTGSGGRPADPSETSLRDNMAQQLTKGTTSATYNIASAECRHTGMYTCSAGNGMGPSDVTATHTLFVKCRPRSDTAQLPRVIFRNQSSAVLFDVTAYPSPNGVTFAYLGTSPNGTARSLDCCNVTLLGTCLTSSRSLYTSQCVVIVDKMTSSAAGFYRVTVSNSQGSAMVVVEIVHQDPGADSDTSISGSDIHPHTVAMVILAVLLLLVIIAVVVVVVWLWRRQWVLPCAGEQSAVIVAEPKPDSSESLVESVYEIAADNPAGPVVGARLSAADDASDVQPQPYDSLQMSDVGLRSPYAQLGQRQAPKDTHRSSGSHYQNVT